MRTYVSHYEVLTFTLKGDSQESAGAGLPDLCCALNALDPQGWISQIISHLAKRLLYSFLILLREGAIAALETPGSAQTH